MNFIDNRHIFGGLNGEKLASMLGIDYMSIDDILNKYKNTFEKNKTVNFG